jgi:hypothetical protein
MENGIIMVKKEVKMSYKIIDNLLSKSELETIQSTMEGPDFPWHLHHKVKKDIKLDGSNENYNFQFIHGFYNNFAPTSPFAEMLNPILERIDPAAIMRIKANLTPATPEIIEYGMHTDYGLNGTTNHSGKSAVFYVNSNDGYTVFENGEKVESVANRLLVFDPHTLHSGSSHTNTKARIVINLNYFEWDSK